MEEWKVSPYFWFDPTPPSQDKKLNRFSLIYPQSIGFCALHRSAMMNVFTQLDMVMNLIIIATTIYIWSIFCYMSSSKKPYIVKDLNNAIVERNWSLFKTIIQSGTHWTEESIDLMFQYGTYEIYNFWTNNGLFVNYYFNKYANNWNKYMALYDSPDFLSAIAEKCEPSLKHQLIMYALSYGKNYEAFKSNFQNHHKLLIDNSQNGTNESEIAIFGPPKEGDIIFMCSPLSDNVELISDPVKMEHINSFNFKIVLTYGNYNTRMIIRDINLIKKISLLPVKFVIPVQLIEYLDPEVKLKKLTAETYNNYILFEQRGIHTLIVNTGLNPYFAEINP